MILEFILSQCLVVLNRNTSYIYSETFAQVPPADAFEGGQAKEANIRQLKQCLFSSRRVVIRLGDN